MRLRARAQQARVVDEEVQAVPGGLDQPAAVHGVGDVAADGDDIGPRRELGMREGEIVRAPSVDHQAPSARGELPGQCETEAPRRARDDCGLGFVHARRRYAEIRDRTIGNWS